MTAEKIAEYIVALTVEIIYMLGAAYLLKLGFDLNWYATFGIALTLWAMKPADAIKV